jgi:hypothetical protein
MNRQFVAKIDHVIVLVCICLIGISLAEGSKAPPAELIGTWDYTSMTALKGGKPFSRGNGR